MSAPITVEQVVDVDSYTIQVRLDPAQIVTALANDLRTHMGALALTRHLAPDHPEHVHARAALEAALAETFTVALTPAQAGVLDRALWEAVEPPERCVHDEAFAVAVVEGVGLCASHAKAWDDAEEMSS